MSDLKGIKYIICIAVLLLLPNIGATAQVDPCANPTIVGTNGDDTIRGTANNDIIDAKGGNDIVYAGDGDDIVCGSTGNDRISGGDGNDRIAVARINLSRAIVKGSKAVRITFTQIGTVLQMNVAATVSRMPSITCFVG